MNFPISKFTFTLFFTFFLNINNFASEWDKTEKSEPKLFNVEVLESTAQIISDSIDFSSTTEAHRRIEIKSEVFARSICLFFISLLVEIFNKGTFITYKYS